MRAGDWQQRLDEWTETGEVQQLLPELTALNGVQQPEKFHAEGDVYTHTRLAVASLDPAADERVFWAVLLHDIGKLTTTEFVAGSWRAHGHVQESAELVPVVLERLSLTHLNDDVVWLVGHHHFVLDWGNSIFKKLTSRQRRFCALPLFPLLVEVCRADAAGSMGGSDKLERLEWVLLQLEA